MSVDRPSLLYIVVAGVVIPMIFGSIVAAVFTFWNQFVAIAAVVAGACFILAVVRLLNQRHDPRHTRQPAEPSDSIRDIHQT